MKKKHDSRKYFARKLSERTPCMILLSIALVPLLLFPGCAMVGPDYVKPDMESGDAWHSPLVDGLTAGPTDPETMARWWETLKDPVLSNLMTISVEGSLDLREAYHRVQLSRDEVGVDLQELEKPLQENP